MKRKEQLLQMLKDDPQNSFLLFALAKEYEGEAEWKDAIKQYTVLMNADPDYVGLYYHLAKAHEEIEQTEDAIAAYDAGIAVATRLSDLHALSELKGARMNLELEL